MSAIEFQRQMKKQFNVSVKVVQQSGKKVRVYMADE